MTLGGGVGLVGVVSDAGECNSGVTLKMQRAKKWTNKYLNGCMGSENG